MRRSVLLLLVLLAAVAAPALAQQEPVIARLVSFDGALDVLRQGIPLAIYPELPLFSGDIVHTKDGRATLRYDDRSELRMRQNTRLQISERKERREVDVFLGRLWAFVVTQKEHPTLFRTGATVAAVRGTKIEYAVGEDGTIEIGVIEGVLEVTVTLPDGSTSVVNVQAGTRTSIPKGGAPSALVKFKEGDIAGAGGTTAEVPEKVTPADLKPAPAPPPAPPAPSAAHAAAAGAEERAPTQGDYAVKLVNALGIGSALPPNATTRDAMEFLARLGILPCDCKWVEDKEITLADLLCIAGIDPNDPNAPLTISLEELISKILEKYGELFWIQTRRKQTVSPFAP